MVTIGDGRLKVRWESSRLNGGVGTNSLTLRQEREDKWGEVLFIICTNQLSMECFSVPEETYCLVSLFM